MPPWWRRPIDPFHTYQDQCPEIRNRLTPRMDPVEKHQNQTDHDEKAEHFHVEDGKIVNEVEPTVLQQGGLDTLTEGRSPWKVLLENPRALALIMAVQVGRIPRDCSRTCLTYCRPGS